MLSSRFSGKEILFFPFSFFKEHSGRGVVDKK